MDRKKKKLIEKCLKGIAKMQFDFVDVLYDVVQAKLFFTAFKYLRNETKAEEVTADFWGDIVRIAKKYQYSKNPINYLNKIVRNLALMRIRSDKSKAKREVVATLEFIEEYQAVEFDYVLDEQRQLLHKSMEKGFKLLDDRKKEVIYNIYWGDCSLRRCAQEMGISKSTVDRLKKSATEKLKTVLTEDGWDTNDV